MLAIHIVVYERIGWRDRW